MAAGFVPAAFLVLIRNVRTEVANLKRVFSGGLIFAAEHLDGPFRNSSVAVHNPVTGFA